MLLALVLRLPNIEYPNKLVFDETYYPKHAWTQMHFGYPTSWPADPEDNPDTPDINEAEGLPTTNDRIVAGEVNIYTENPDNVVHPMLGKWLIALGIQMFGMNSFGWRFASLIFGVLLVGATVRLARRLARSTLIGALAGFLICVDGLSFVMSRIGLLDIFQATFAVAAVAAVVADRDWFRNKLADHLEKNNLLNLNGAYGPLLLWRPWRLIAGVLFGMSIAVKWNSLYLLAVMGILSVVFDWRARRAAGARSASWGSVLKEGPLAFFYLVVVAFGVYLASWASWLATTGGYMRNWGEQNPDSTLVKLLGAPLASLVEYHKWIFDFHTGDWMANEVTHVYEGNPAGWLVIGRTLGIDAVNGIKPGVDGCTAEDGETCVRVISAMGTPVLWWLALIALIAGVGFWIFGRDWRFGVPVVAMAATWIGWFPNDDRPLFYFYAIMIIPFTATILAMCLGKILGPAKAGRRRKLGAIAVGVIVAIITLNFAFIYPILTDTLLTRVSWSMRMWFSSWI
jgi:dolichyl-phosphate-mannose--protein O-mannosyl transferase